MAKQNGINGAVIAAAFVGSILLWSGVRGKGISDSFRSVLSGNSPSNNPQVDSITDASTAGTVTTQSDDDEILTGSVPEDTSAIGAKVVQYAQAQLGKKYVFATHGPNTFDCSGLTSAAYASAGISIVPQSLVQWNTCIRLTEDQLQPGDLIFYYPTVHHVAIFVGNGQLIEASEPGVPVHQIPVYNDAQNPIKGYGRFL